MNLMNKEIKTLTGLRGIAATIVVLYHFIEFDAHYLDPVSVFIRRIGYLGVDVFFVLSGFVMALSYARYFKSRISADSYRSFMIKRVARIYPLYFLITILSSIKYLFNFTGHEPRDYHLPDFVACLLMVQNWGLPFTSVTGATWSLSTEFFAYIIFPALVFLAVFARPVYTSALAVVSAILIYLVAASQLGKSGQLDVVVNGSVMPLMRCLAGFCFGLICYRLAQTEICRKLFAPSAVTLVLLAGLVTTATLTRSDLAVFAFFPLIVLALYYNSTVGQFIFSNRLVYHLGVISYSIYLVHPLIKPVMTQLAPRAEQRFGPVAHSLSLLLAVLLTWLAAYLLYTFVEMPGRNYVQKLLLPAKADGPVKQTV